MKTKLNEGCPLVFVHRSSNVVVDNITIAGTNLEAVTVSTTEDFEKMVKGVGERLAKIHAGSKLSEEGYAYYVLDSKDLKGELDSKLNKIFRLIRVAKVLVTIKFDDDFETSSIFEDFAQKGNTIN